MTRAPRARHARPSFLLPTARILPARAAGSALPALPAKKAHRLAAAAAAVALVAGASALVIDGSSAATPKGGHRADAAGRPDPRNLPGAPALELSPASRAALRGHAVPKRAKQAAKPGSNAPALGLAASGIPITALHAYQQAAQREATVNPACHIQWPLLAGIGRVESDHGRFAGATLHADGLSTPPVVGIPLNGKGTAVIRDTDGGAMDGDPVYDRAVGPMQFIPSTWSGYGVDANHDGTSDPFNIFDAAAAAADYLCAAGGDLTTTAGQVRAILSYNHSFDYVQLVMTMERLYASGSLGVTVPVLPTAPPTDSEPLLPPVNPGPPPAGEDAKRAAAAAPTGTRSGSTAASSSAASSTAASGGSSSTSASPSGSTTGSTGSSSSGSTGATSSSAASSSAAPSSSAASTSTSSSSSATTSTPPPAETSTQADASVSASDSGSGSTTP